MKINFKVIIVLLLIASKVFSQGKKPEEIKDFFWNSKDKQSNTTEIPEKWQNESAVVLYKNINYAYHKFGKKVTYKTSVRKRIKLLDKNAVKEFSEFNFKKRFYSNRGNFTRKASKMYFGVKVIKPDGKEIEIDVDKEAVKGDDKYKLAISNLEVGDIIDYYFYSIEPFVSKYSYSFEPVETPLGEEYPMVFLKMNLESENDFFINFKSINGAPKLKEIPTGKKNRRKYVLEAKDIDKNEFPRWYFPLSELPSIKMQVYFARSESYERSTAAFLPEKENIIKSKVTENDILELYNFKLDDAGKIKNIQKYLADKNFKSNEEKVIDVFYYMRHFYLNRYIEGIFAEKLKMLDFPFMNYKNFNYIRGEEHFVNIFTTFLKSNKIPYKIIVATKRYNGKIEDLLIDNNVNLIIKVNTKNPLYVTAFKPHTTISYINPYLEGTEVYKLSKTKPKSSKFDVIKKGKLPTSKYTDNEMQEILDVKVKPDFSGFKMAITNKLKGHLKLQEQSDRLIFRDYVYNEYKKYNSKSLVEFVKGKKNKARVKKEINALIEKLKKNQKKYFENQIKSELGLTELNNFSYKIEQNGRFSPSSYFVYSQKFDFDKKFLKKAGPNYIVDIGEFIGGQIEIDDKFRKRDANIYMKNPRVYNYTIKFTIPDGYKVVGLDKLQKKVDNSSGAFISNAKMEGNTLIIKTSKQYKHNFYTKDKWPEILAFLDEANQFKNEKILLKKAAK